MGGLALTLYATNTSINGIQFQEYINIRISDNNYVKASYGENTYNNVVQMTGGKTDNA